MENSDTERNQTFSVIHQTVFHMNPKPNGDFTEPTFGLLLDWFLSQRLNIIIPVVLSVSLPAIGAMPFLFYGSDLLSQNSRYFNWHMKHACRHTIQEICISNPEGVIKYKTVSGNPLIDLEMDEDVRNHMLTASLVKLKKKKWEHRRVHELTIRLNGRAEGILMIKEY